MSLEFLVAAFILSMAPVHNSPLLDADHPSLSHEFRKVTANSDTHTFSLLYSSNQLDSQYFGVLLDFGFYKDNDFNGGDLIVDIDSKSLKWKATAIRPITGILPKEIEDHILPKKPTVSVFINIRIPTQEFCELTNAKDICLTIGTKKIVLNSNEKNLISQAAKVLNCIK